MTISQNTLDTLQDAPQPNMQPDEFNLKAFAFAAVLYTLGLEINETVSTLNQASTTSESGDTLTIGLGAKNLTVEAGKSFAVGMTVRIADTVTGTRWMNGDVTAYDPLTGNLSVNVSAIQGSGNANVWTISQSFGGLTAGSVDTNKLADLAVTTEKIANNAITLEKVDNGVINAPPGRLLNVVMYKTAGVFTWTKPGGCNSIEVEVWGAGGGGGNSAGNGGTSSFSLVSATGGHAGDGSYGGFGGLGSGGDLNSQGGAGGNINPSNYGGAGGCAPRGGGGGASNGVAGTAGGFPGGGGGSRGASVTTGGAGGYAYKYYQSAPSSATVVVGEPGAAGSSGYAGGGGLIVVKEYA